MAIAPLDGWDTITAASSDPDALGLTISAGVNRVAIAAFWSVFNETAFGSITQTITLGGQSPTNSYKVTYDSVSMQHWFHVWNESAISSMSGTNLNYSDDETADAITRSFGTFSGVDQASPVKSTEKTELGGVSSGNASVSGTDSASDYVILGILRGGTGNDVDSWDALSEQFDSATTGGSSQYRIALGQGNGSDTSIALTGSGFAEWLCHALVLREASGTIAPQAYHLRNHGKFY